jgi:general secretion pathway protein H
MISRNKPLAAERRNKPLEGDRQAGFTLIEMVVVIAVLGIVLGVLSTFAPPRSHWLQTVAAGDRVAAAMHDAQARAISSGQPVTWTPPDLPGWMIATVSVPPGGLVFEPDGSATGGLVTLTFGYRRVTVAADWLTGRIQVDAP